MNRKTEAIRKALKEMGYNQRQVSVKDRPGGLSYSITLTIRDASVNYKDVEKIEKQFTSIDRDMATGEILGGGNTFMHINIADNVREIWAAPFIPKITEAVSKLNREGYGEKIDERFIVFKENDYQLKVWDEIERGWMFCNYSIHNLQTIALDIHERIN